MSAIVQVSFALDDIMLSGAAQRSESSISGWQCGLARFKHLSG
jgi:hypothetical protein